MRFKPHPVSLRSTAPLRRERGKNTRTNVPLRKRSDERDGLRSKQGEVTSVSKERRPVLDKLVIEI